jgi:hypothetical protein
MLTLNENGTYTPSGGTAVSFNATGKSVSGGREYINSSETDFFVRESVTLSYKAPTVDQDGNPSKARCTATIVRPRKDPDTGKVTYNLIRIQLECDPIAGPTEMDNLRSIALSALSDSELTAFWQSGSLPE